MVIEGQNRQISKKCNTVKFENFKDNISMFIGEEQEEVLLFFSFDIVNSSLYKTINYYGWSDVLAALFEQIRKFVRNEIEDVKLWRVLGDEIIFIVKIHNEDQLHLYVNKIYSILIDIVNKINNGEIYKSILKNKKFSSKEFNIMKLQNILSLKGTAWIAIVHKENFSDNYDMSDEPESNNDNFSNYYESKKDDMNIQYENLSKGYHAADNYYICEFLGNDIDTGFRISKETCDRRLVISFELAYLLSRRTEDLSKLFIITYKKLKGIWKDRLYPIIWYYDKEKSNNINFEESFYYDEIEQCDLVREYFKNNSNDKEYNNITYKYMYTDVEHALDKILKNTNLQEKITKIKSVISKTNDKDTNYIKPPHLEFQCVAVCFDENNDKILIVKRKNNKDNYANMWEFGSVSANLNENIETTIIKIYKKIFNIDVEIIMDEKREDKQPIPIAIYEIPKEGKLHKGVIVLAKRKGVEQVKLAEASNYSDCKWIGRDEAQKYDEEGGVPDFLNTIYTVFEEMEKYKDKR